MRQNRCWGTQFVALVALVLVSRPLGVCAAREPSDLERQLARIGFAERLKGVALVDLEKQCLSLIPDHNTPAQRGQIFAKITSIYAERGFTSDQDPRITKTITYAAKALEQKLDAATACQMYTWWAGAVMRQSWKYREARFREGRPKALVLCLKGLKLALDNDAPEEHPGGPPALDRISVAPGTLGFDELMVKHEQQIKAREEWDVLVKLYVQRRALTQQCIAMYARQPHDLDEFLGEAGKVLVGHEDVVLNIAEQIQERIAALEPPRAQ